MARSVAEYYATNYTRCTVDRSFLASWRGVAYPVHVIQIIAIPFALLTSYCILKKTPPTMSSVKWPLLNSHIWCTLLDVITCSLTTPYFLFPAQGGFTVGLLNLFHVPIPFQVCIGSVVVTGTLVSLLYLYELRSSFIEDNWFRMRRRSSRIILYSTNVFFGLVLIVPISLNPTGGQETAKLAALEITPCPTEEFFLPSVFIAITDATIALQITVGVVLNTVFLAAQFFFFAGCCVYYLFYAPSVTTSAQTRHLQRRFFIGLCLQTGVPFFFLGAPCTALYTAFVFDRLTQKLNNLVVISFSLHGVSESITVVLVHQTYREFVRKAFVLRCGLIALESSQKSWYYTMSLESQQDPYQCQDISVTSGALPNSLDTSLWRLSGDRCASFKSCI